MTTRATLRPKKSLSQNFLIDKNISHKIAAALEVQPDECVVEIGPGTGALTRELVEQCKRLYCVELDARAVEQLRQHFAVQLTQNMTLVNADILATDLRELVGDECGTISVIGNIPYAITSGILFWLFDHAALLRRSVLMMQKEVARRLVAQPRSKDYGILTLAVAMTCRVHHLFDVKPGSFFPAPAVTSSVVRLDFLPDPMPLAQQQRMRSLIRAAFGQRRKTLRNALQSYVHDQYQCDIRTIECRFWDQRAEELTLPDFEELLRFLEEHRK